MAEEPQMDSLRADLLEAQQSEAEARAALQQSAEYGKLLLSRNEALEQELEVLRQELGRKVAAEVSQRSRLEEECRRLEQELETKSKPQERHGYSRTSRLLSLSGSLDSDEEPNVAQMQQRLKRCETNEQEHREAAWLAEEHANMLEEQNQKLEEECRRLQAQLTRSRPNDEVVQRWQKAGSLVRDSLRDTEDMEISEKGLGRSLQGQVGHIHSNGGSAPTSPSSWSPFRRRTARLSASEDLEQLVSTVSSERDAALAEKAASEAHCEARLREMDEEVTALRLLLEEETARTDTMAQHIDYLGSMLEEQHAVNGAAVMLKSLGLSRPGSPERGELLSAALAKGRPEGNSARLRPDSVASQEEVPSLQSFLADLRSRSPSQSRRSRAPHCTLEEFLGEKPTSLANVTASTRAVASLSPSDTDAKKVSLLELLGWSRCSHCGSLMWFSNGQSNGSNGSNGHGRNQNNVCVANGKKNLAKSWTLALSQEAAGQPVRGRTPGGR